MSATDLLSIAANLAAVLSLIISIWALRTAKSVEKNMSVDSRTTFSGTQTISGSGNTQAGGTVNQRTER